MKEWQKSKVIEKKKPTLKPNQNTTIKMEGIQKSKTSEKEFKFSFLKH